MQSRVWILVSATVLTGTVLVGILLTGDVVRLHPWELRGEPAATATSVSLTVLGGGCGADTERVARVEVEETAHQVTIGTYIRKDRFAAGQACTAVGTAHHVTAHLDQPLGSRRLVDTACVRDRSHQQCDVRER